MELVHEPFGEADAGGFGGGHHGRDLARVHGHGLLTEHVLAGAQGPDGPFGVEVVRQRVVDGVDAGVVDQILIAPVGSLETEVRRTEGDVNCRLPLSASQDGGSGSTARRRLIQISPSGGICL